MGNGSWVFADTIAQQREGGITQLRDVPKDEAALGKAFGRYRSSCRWLPSEGLFRAIDGPIIHIEERIMPCQERNG